MPGIAGVARFRSPLVDAEIRLQRLKDLSQIPGISFEHKSAISKNVLLYNCVTGLIPEVVQQPATDARSGTSLLLEGQIFNTDELRVQFDAAATESVCQILLRAFQQKGDTFVECLNGEFNIVVYTADTDSIRLYSDHIASMPMYYVSTPHAFAFASEKKYLRPLVDDSPSLDPFGLIQIVAHRHNLNEQTILSNVRRMMPRQYIHATDSGTTAKQLRFSPTVQSTLDDIPAEWANQLQLATERRLRGKTRVILSLSGGLDSRAIACAIPRDFRPMWTRTAGSRGMPDVDLAEEISARLGFEHLHQSQRDLSVSEVIGGIAWRTECETHFANALSITHHHETKHRADFVAGGWLGDVSSGGHIAPAMLLTRSESKFRDLVFRRMLTFPGDTLSKVFSADALSQQSPRLRQAFDESFSSASGSSLVQRFEQWDLDQRQRRQTTSSMPVDSHLFEKIRPFYDRHYLDFVSAIPFHMRVAQLAYQAVIYKLGPELRDLPNANTGLPLRSSFSGNVINEFRRIAMLARRRISMRLVRHSNEGAEKKVSQSLSEPIRRDTRLHEIIEEFLGSRFCDPSIFFHSGIRQMLSEHKLGRQDHTYALGYVATFASGLPMLLDDVSSLPESAGVLKDGASY